MNPLSSTWPYVLAFARRMEAKLEKNRHKGNRDGWMKDSPAQLLKRLGQETRELSEALERRLTNIALNARAVGEVPFGMHGPSDEEIADEAADVANFAMMIADVCGGVTPQSSLGALLSRVRPGAKFIDELVAAKVAKLVAESASPAPVEATSKVPQLGIRPSGPCSEKGCPNKGDTDVCDSCDLALCYDHSSQSAGPSRCSACRAIPRLK